MLSHTGNAVEVASMGHRHRDIDALVFIRTSAGTEHGTIRNSLKI